MRAVVVDRLMEPSELKVREADPPKLAPGCVAVDVRAAGCNFFDILMCQGKYQMKPPLPFIPGAEAAGVVAEVAGDVKGVAAGDHVLLSTPLGAFAERVVAPARAVWKMPEKMSFEEGAALPIVYPTSYAALVYRAKIEPGEWLLVHAAAGGVGIAAVQIGRALGARVIATAGGPEKLEVARSAGGEVLIDYEREDFVERVMEATGGKGAAVIYDSVGGDVFDRSLKCIAWSGRLLVIGFAGGRIPEVKANRILLKNVSVVGLHWGAYAIHEPARIPETMNALFRLYDEGKIRPVIFRTYPLERISDALVALGGRKTWGKVIVAP